MKRKLEISSSRFPLDVATLLGPFFIFLPSLLLSGAFTAALYHTRRLGDPTLPWIAGALGFIGAVLLFFARLPLYRQRRFFAFGPRQLDLPIGEKLMRGTGFF
jgi:hypothetical protein